MIIHVTYSFVIGSVLAFVDSKAENDDEVKYEGHFNRRIASMIREKTEGGLDDDDNFLYTDFNSNIQGRMERIFKRIVHTVSKETGIKYKLGIIFVPDY